MAPDPRVSAGNLFHQTSEISREFDDGFRWPRMSQLLRSGNETGSQTCLDLRPSFKLDACLAVNISRDHVYGTGVPFTIILPLKTLAGALNQGKTDRA